MTAMAKQTVDPLPLEIVGEAEGGQQEKGTTVTQCDVYGHDDAYDANSQVRSTTRQRCRMSCSIGLIGGFAFDGNW